MPSTSSQPDARIVTGYTRDLATAMELVSGVMVDLQQRCVEAAFTLPIEPTEPWRAAADNVIADLRPLASLLALTLAPSPDAPLQRLKA